MTLGPWRAKVAALIILFVLGTFAGQIRHLLDTVRGKVETGARITDELRTTVTTIGQAVDLTSEALRGQIADLQAKLAAGTASPAQVTQLRGLVERLSATPARSGPSGPPGPAGAPGPPGPPPATSSTSTSTATSPGGTTSTTRPPPGTSTTTRPPPTTTTTRCAVGLGQLLKVGC